jgi:hypothetical protein
VVLMGGVFVAVLVFAVRPLLTTVPGWTLVGAGVFAVVALDAGAAAVLLPAGRLLGSLRLSGWLVDCAHAELANTLIAEARSNGLMFIRAPRT